MRGSIGRPDVRAPLIQIASLRFERVRRKVEPRGLRLRPDTPRPLPEQMCSGMIATPSRSRLLEGGWTRTGRLSATIARNRQILPPRHSSRSNTPTSPGERNFLAEKRRLSVRCTNTRWIFRFVRTRRRRPFSIRNCIERPPIPIAPLVDQATELPIDVSGNTNSCFGSTVSLGKSRGNSLKLHSDAPIRRTGGGRA